MAADPPHPRRRRPYHLVGRGEVAQGRVKEDEAAQSGRHRTMNLKEWPLFGAPSKFKISKWECLRAGSNLRKAAGEASAALELLPRYLCNHQLADRVCTSSTLSTLDV